ncbi:MAG: hypothetical protein DYG89_36395 [Caldilinea sp. CFX5]|nr:hypothetical protein [Caldilinea sp. CFX5]
MLKPVGNTAGKTTIRTVALWLVLALLLSACQPIAAVSTANASVTTAMTGMAAPEQAQCTLATLKGRYLFATYGTILPPAFGVTEPTPGASAGFHTFNGDGTGTDTVTVRVGSETVRENAVVPIRYTVNADCTGAYTVLIDGGPSFGLFIAPKGEAISVIATAPAGNYVSSIDQRVSTK